MQVEHGHAAISNLRGRRVNQAELLLLMVQIWAGIGGLVAVAFLSFGIDQIDEDARGAYVFRPLLVPGILLIWPLVLWRWAALRGPEMRWAARYHPPRAAHQVFAWGMALAILLAIGLGLSVRQNWPADIPAQQLALPSEAEQ